VIVAGATYVWTLDGTPLTTTATAYLKIATAGVYTVQVVKDNCGSSVSADFNAVATGIRNSNAVKAFEIYPNPTEGRLTLSLTLIKNSTVQLSIYSPEGRELFIRNYGSTRSVSDELNMQPLAKGVYIIKLRVDSDVYYHKVVKD
jgi:hypothetical protein